MRGGEEDVRVAFVGPLLGCAGSVLDRGGQVQRGEAALEALRLPVGPELLSVLLGVFAALARLLGDLLRVVLAPEFGSLEVCGVLVGVAVTILSGPLRVCNSCNLAFVDAIAVVERSDPMR